MRQLPLPARELSEQQHSLLARRQLHELGLPDVAIHRLQLAGVLERKGRGQFRLAGAAASWLEEVALAVDRCGPGAHVAGSWALGLRGIKGFDLSGDRQIAIPPQRRVRGVDFTVVRSPVPPEDQDEVLGLPTVTVERALIDIAAFKARSTVRTAYYDAKFNNQVDGTKLARRAQELGRVPGALQMRAIIASGALGLDSEGEHNLLEIFKPGDPLPQPQVWVGWHDRSYRLDFAYLDARMDLEYDSRTTHDDRFHEDRDRDLALAELDIMTVRITKAMLRAPARTRGRILAVRRRRLALGLPPITPLPRSRPSTRP